MTDQQTPESDAQNIAQAIQEVSERAQLLVREEIELAKVEVTEKVTKLVRGAAIGAAAGVFVLFAIFLFFDGLAWLVYWAVPSFPDQAFFWGFFIVAAVLFLLAALAAFIAARAFKSATPPTPAMAIDEAKLIRETVQSSQPERTV
jgi:uncharacterized membrane protein YqjE